MASPRPSASSPACTSSAPQQGCASRRDHLAALRRQHAHGRRIHIGEELALHAAQQQPDAPPLFAERRRHLGESPFVFTQRGSSASIACRRCGSSLSTPVLRSSSSAMPDSDTRPAVAAERAAVRSWETGRRSDGETVCRPANACAGARFAPRVDSISASYCTPEGHAVDARHAAQAGVEMLHPFGRDLRLARSGHLHQIDPCLAANPSHCPRARRSGTRAGRSRNERIG